MIISEFKIPCSPEAIYYLVKDGNIKKGKFTGMQMDTNKKISYFLEDGIRISADEFNKTLFLSEEEARQEVNKR